MTIECSIIIYRPKLVASAAVCANNLVYSSLVSVVNSHCPSQMVSPQTGVRRPERVYICCKSHGDDDGMLHYHLPTRIAASLAVSVNLF